MNYRYYIVTIVSLIILFSACPEPPDNGGDVADCPKGQLPCEDDSTECCNVECPEGYHLGGADSTECIPDTTSHNFRGWKIDTLGIYFSYLNDVAIIDENNIWVVGKIETDTATYNAAHWDGSEWEFELIGVPGVIGEGIYYFAEDDIWIATGIIYHWNGGEWERYHLWDMGVLDPNDGGVKKIWGTSSSNIYFVGRNGSIVHYNGTIFTKMNSGTGIDLIDVFGIKNNVLAVGYNDYGEFTGQSIALHLYNGQWRTIRHENNFYPASGTDEFGLISAVWAFDDTAYIMTYSGIRKYNLNDYKLSLWISRYDMGASDFHIVSFKGNAPNDIIFADRWSNFIHYNGLTWKTFTDLYDLFPNGQLVTLGMDFKENFVAAVGTLHGPEQAVIIRGYRQ